MVQIFGPDLANLEELGRQVIEGLKQMRLKQMPQFREVHLVQFAGQPELTFVVDREKCNRHGITVAEVNTLLKLTMGRSITQMVEGDMLFDIVLNWTGKNQDPAAILDMPVEIPDIENINRQRVRLRDLVRSRKQPPRKKEFGLLR